VTAHGVGIDRRDAMSMSKKDFVALADTFQYGIGKAREDAKDGETTWPAGGSELERR